MSSGYKALYNISINTTKSSCCFWQCWPENISRLEKWLGQVLHMFVVNSLQKVVPKYDLRQLRWSPSKLRSWALPVECQYAHTWPNPVQNKLFLSTDMHQDTHKHHFTKQLQSHRPASVNHWMSYKFHNIKQNSCYLLKRSKWSWIPQLNAYRSEFFSRNRSQTDKHLELITDSHQSVHSNDQKMIIYHTQNSKN